MDDALLVCGFERFGDLPRNGERLVERERTLGDALGERRPLDQLHDERAHAGGVLEPVNVRDVRMIERRERLRLAFEPGEPLGIVRERLRQHLQRDVAIELRVARAIDLPHPACPELAQDFVWSLGFRAAACQVSRVEGPAPSGEGHRRGAHP